MSATNPETPAADGPADPMLDESPIYGKPVMSLELLQALRNWEDEVERTVARVFRMAGLPTSLLPARPSGSGSLPKPDSTGK